MESIIALIKINAYGAHSTIGLAVALYFGNSSLPWIRICKIKAIAPYTKIKVFNSVCAVPVCLYGLIGLSTGMVFAVGSAIFSPFVFVAKLFTSDEV